MHRFSLFFTALYYRRVPVHPQWLIFLYFSTRPLPWFSNEKLNFDNAKVTCTPVKYVSFFCYLNVRLKISYFKTFAILLNFQMTVFFTNRARHFNIYCTSYHSMLISKYKPLPGQKVFQPVYCQSCLSFQYFP